MPGGRTSMAVKIKIGKCSKELGQWPVRHSRPPRQLSARRRQFRPQMCAETRAHTRAVVSPTHCTPKPCRVGLQAHIFVYCTHTRAHTRAQRQTLLRLVFRRSIYLSVALTLGHIITGSGGIIQTNAIYSILVSLTPDPGPSAASPWQPSPCARAGCAHWSHL